MRNNRSIASLPAIVILAALSVHAQTFTIPELTAHLHDKVIEMLVPDTATLVPVAKLAEAAEIVVDARLVRPRSHLSDDQKKIYTDYEIVPNRLVRSQIGDILNSTPPGVSTPLLLTVIGGNIVLDGKEIRATNEKMKAIKTGARYLIFASRSQQTTGAFMLLGGPSGLFEVLEDEHIDPMLRTSQENPSEGASLETVVRQVQAAPVRR